MSESARDRAMTDLQVDLLRRVELALRLALAAGVSDEEIFATTAAMVAQVRERRATS